MLSIRMCKLRRLPVFYSFTLFYSCKLFKIQVVTNSEASIELSSVCPIFIK